MGVPPGLTSTPQRPETALYGFAYVGLADDRQHVKLGITLDPARRKRQIETASGRTIVKWEQFWVYAPAACERCLLERWQFFRVAGEWLAGGEHLFNQITAYLGSRVAGNSSFVPMDDAVRDR